VISGREWKYLSDYGGKKSFNHNQHKASHRKVLCIMMIYVIGPLIRPDWNLPRQQAVSIFARQAFFDRNSADRVEYNTSGKLVLDAEQQ